MHTQIIKALVDTKGKTVGGNVVPMPAGSFHEVSGFDVDFYRAHPDVFAVYDRENGDVPVTAVTDAVTGATEGLSVNGRTMFKSLAPADRLDGAEQMVVQTAAFSTTVGLNAIATGTAYKARVVWLNNGASGTAKLNIVANSLNAVEGVVASQNATRRDYQLTIEGSVILVSDVPITRLDFTSDGSISNATHSLQVTFGN